jgi:hypothetical protein
VPQLLVYLAVAVHEAVGNTVCVREVPVVPQPDHDQLPPEAGVGAKATETPEATVALDVDEPLMTGPMVVAGQAGGVTTAPYEQYRGEPTLVAGNRVLVQLIGPVRLA